jgi:hypothetical protein
VIPVVETESMLHLADVEITTMTTETVIAQNVTTNVTPVPPNTNVSNVLETEEKPPLTVLANLDSMKMDPPPFAHHVLTNALPVTLNTIVLLVLISEFLLHLATVWTDTMRLNISVNHVHTNVSPVPTITFALLVLTSESKSHIVNVQLVCTTKPENKTQSVILVTHNVSLALELLTTVLLVVETDPPQPLVLVQSIPLNN